MMEDDDDDNYYGNYPQDEYAEYGNDYEKGNENDN